jgi:hypothetical protein
MILGDNDGSTLTIVEFKRPSRNDYAMGSEKSDPVLQVLNMLSKAVTEGGITKTDGTFFSFANVVRKFAFAPLALIPCARNGKRSPPWDGWSHRERAGQKAYYFFA